MSHEDDDDKDLISPKSGATLWVGVVALLAVGGIGAWLFLGSGSSCGDGLCATGSGEDPTSCPKDCTAPSKGLGPPAPPSVTPAPPRATADAGPTETSVTATAPASAPDAGASATVGGAAKDGSVASGDAGDAKAAEVQAEAPIVQPPGRCQVPEFLEIIGKTVARCQHACKFNASNPLIGLDQVTFETLFGKLDDPGVATHFALFGCNRYTANKDCLGFDSHFADPLRCPGDESRQANCTKYATVIKDELWRFLDANASARYFVLLGTASRSGNLQTRPPQMSEENKDLALKRAEAVQEVIELYRIEKKIKGEVLPVVLDNESQDYESPTFVRLVEEQLAKAGKAERGFRPTNATAINRSVAIVAIGCDLREELKKHPPSSLGPTPAPAAPGAAPQPNGATAPPAPAPGAPAEKPDPKADPSKP
jgi:hypothetical protein